MKKLIVVFLFAVWFVCVSYDYSKYQMECAISEMIQVYRPKYIRICERKKLLVGEVGGHGAFRKLVFRVGYNVEDNSFLRIVALEATDAHDFDGSIRYYYSDAKDFYQSKPDRISYPEWEKLLPFEVDENEHARLWKKLLGNCELELLDGYDYGEYVDENKNNAAFP